MKKIIILSMVLSLIAFSGCSFFSEKNNAEDTVISTEMQNGQQPAVENVDAPAVENVDEPAVENVNVQKPENNNDVPAIETTPAVVVPAPTQPQNTEPAAENTEQPAAENNNEPQAAEDNPGNPVAEASESPEVKLAKCLAAKGAELYTTYTCPHCITQKNLFKDGVQYLNNIECSGTDGWTKVCLDNDVKAVPTWIFADGQRLTGSRSLEVIAETSGCEYTAV